MKLQVTVLEKPIISNIKGIEFVSLYDFSNGSLEKFWLFGIFRWENTSALYFKFNDVYLETVKSSRNEYNFLLKCSSYKRKKNLSKKEDNSRVALQVVLNLY
jgi:hypothetical protein